jgi:glycosyltransferase involved in cell wall biosynthesis
LLQRSHKKMIPFSIIVPANNEEDYLDACLDALWSQSYAGPAEVIVSGNACTDSTLSVAESWRERFSAKGWKIELIDRPEAGKCAALNAADVIAAFPARIYLDADVICSENLLTELSDTLDTTSPLYASGKLTLAPSSSWITRQFGRTWRELPFVATNVPGAGLFAVNASGRSRWGVFPDIISDDLFVRLHFSPEERVEVPSQYYWPLTEGLRNLVRVRRRQDLGNVEIAQRFPNLMVNESNKSLMISDHLRLFSSRPLSYFVYVCVLLFARYGTGRATKGWIRGR